MGTWHLALYQLYFPEASFLVACILKQCISNSPTSTTNFTVNIVEFETHCCFSTQIQTHRLSFLVRSEMHRKPVHFKMHFES